MSNSNIKIKRARLSYPSLFQPSMFEGVSGKYEATFLIPKGDPILKRLRAEAEAVCKAAGHKFATIAESKSCIRDGDKVGKPETAGHVTVKARVATRPLVIDRDRSILTAEDGVIYAGCYVSAIISLWLQDNAYGRRVNANLHGVQFVEDGEPFGAAGGRLDPNAFDNLDEDVDDDKGDDQDDDKPW